MNLVPLLAMFGLGDGQSFVLLMTLLSMLFLLALLAGVAAIVLLMTRRDMTRPKAAPPAPAVPAAPKPAQPSPPATKTVVLPRQCPQCGAPLPPDAPEGLCPACLLQRGIATESGSAAGAKSFVPPAVDELARLFPQLEILECLGRGGMGAVYKARQPRLDRFVALKILAPEKQDDPQFAERFEREARVLARLSHPNIVSVFDFGEVQGRFYLLMEYVDGLTLRQVMQAGKMAPAEALALVPKICEALQYAHNQGIVHRDIKPENILLDKQGRLKIADFGIAKIAGVDAAGLALTGARDIMGTPVYMAPEQVEKPQTVDHRADIYSLGVVFYEMLTGELPLGKFAPPSKKVQVDVRLDEVVLHALEKEPARRYQEASQVKTAVETIAGTPAPISPPAGATPPNPAGNPGSITAPAVALMVAGLWKVLSGLIGLLALGGLTTGIGSLLGIGKLLGAWSAVAISGVVLFKIVPGCLIAFGGYQMQQRRSYAWAVAGGIIAIMACSLLGVPAGIWALIVLSRDDAKAAFGLPAAAVAPASARPDHFGRRFMVVVAGVILIALVLLVIGLATAAFAVPGLFKASATTAAPLTAEEVKQAGIRQEGGDFKRDFNEAFPLNAGGTFSVDNINGRTEIRGWSSNLVAVTALIHGGTAESVHHVKITMDHDAGEVRVHTEIPNPWQNFQWSLAWFKNMLGENATVDYTVRVPQRTRLKDVNSVNGQISIAGVTGDITAATVNGETEIRNASGNLKLDTVNGTIKAEMDALGGGQTVSLNAVNGEMTLTLPENANASFAVGTVNGSISSDFPALQPVHEFPVGNQLNGQLGQGGARVKADAVNGTIKFLKRPGEATVAESAPGLSSPTNK